MVEQGVDCLLVGSGADLRYLTGYEAVPLERITMLAVTPDEAVLFVPVLEAPRVEPGPFEVVSWHETEDPLDLIARTCGNASLVAITDQTWAGFLLGLQERLGGARFESATPLTAPLRLRKSDAEIELLAAAGAAADQVAVQLASVRFRGRSERSLAREIADLVVESGHDRAHFAIVASGPNGASPHHEPGERTIEAGDAVVVDFGGSRQGYCSDTTRTFMVGEPSPEHRLVHEAVFEAQRAALAACAPGVVAEAVDAAARAVIEEAGFGEFFIHRTGHGIGLEVHEHPYLVAGNTESLKSGMCFSIEPGIYLPGRFGVRIEDIVIMTDAGGRSLNNSDRALVTVD